MIKSILFGAATAIALAAIPASAATVAVIDDFSTQQAPITTDKSTFPAGVSRLIVDMASMTFAGVLSPPVAFEMR